MQTPSVIHKNTTQDRSNERPLDTDMLDLYSDYLISSFSYTTATGLSELLGCEISHDAVTRFLNERNCSSKDLWKLVKPIVREHAEAGASISFDDTIQEKAFTDENDIMAWHFDHNKGRNVKGVNILNCFYRTSTINLPLSYDIITKTEEYVDKKSGKKKRRSAVTKNELFRNQVDICIKNNVVFQYVLADSWFGSKEKMEHIISNKKEFIFALKSNRLVALSKEDRRAGRFKRVDTLTLEAGQVCDVYLQGVTSLLRLVKRIFTNKDGSTGTLYLVTSELTIDYDTITATYEKRWGVEEYHKSIKCNAGLAKSPTKTVRSQSNHFFASIYAYIKLELLRIGTGLNHFALKAKLYTNALLASFRELERLRAV